jgi:methionyl-tRNA formyltransferase
MKILVLGKIRSPITQIIQDTLDEVLGWAGPIEVNFLETNQIEFIVSYGYRHIIRPSIIKYLPNRIINLHISYLPWNRGADPNLWSFLENTPKGASIHFVDEGIDTGDIIVQKEVNFYDEGETLLTTYEKLQNEMVQLFKYIWPQIRSGKCPRQKQRSGGTFHKSLDKKKFKTLLVKGWDTPVNILKGKALR